jgi:mannose-6-phosphate isomerase-like protein (cupin superfamily)
MLRSITDEGPQVQELLAGIMAVVPQGMQHRFKPPGGVTLMSVTPVPTDHPKVDVEDPR